MNNDLILTNSIFRILQQMEDINRNMGLDPESQSMLNTAKTYMSHLYYKIGLVPVIRAYHDNTYHGNIYTNPTPYHGKDYVKDYIKDYGELYPETNSHHYTLPDTPTDPRKRKRDRSLYYEDTSGDNIYDKEPRDIALEELLNIDVTKIKEKYIYVHEKFYLNKREIVDEIPDSYKNTMFTRKGLDLYFVKVYLNKIVPYEFYEYYVGKNGFLYSYKSKINEIVPAINKNTFQKWKY